MLAFGKCFPENPPQETGSRRCGSGQTANGRAPLRTVETLYSTCFLMGIWPPFSLSWRGLCSPAGRRRPSGRRGRRNPGVLYETAFYRPSCGPFLRDCGSPSGTVYQVLLPTPKIKLTAKSRAQDSCNNKVTQPKNNGKRQEVRSTFVIQCYDLGNIHFNPPRMIQNIDFVSFYLFFNLPALLPFDASSSCRFCGPVLMIRFFRAVYRLRRMAWIGSSLAARYAGRIPNKTPQAAAQPKLTP